jgi:hypothetical protein
MASVSYTNRYSLRCYTNVSCTLVHGIALTVNGKSVHFYLTMLSIYDKYAHFDW